MMLQTPCLISFTFLVSFITSSWARVPGPSAFTIHPKSRNHILLLPRKISDSNSHPQVVQDIHDLAGCPGEICGTLGGEAIQPLLAGAGECAQQDMADKIIDAAKSQLKDKAVQTKLIELAKLYRQTERNTFPDYSSPSTPDRNSLYCQKSPKNPELSGLFQKQSPTADPNLFFDPKTNGKSLQKGSDPRTQPFGEAKGQTSQPSNTKSAKVVDGDSETDEDDAEGDDGARNADNSGEPSKLSSMAPGTLDATALPSNTRNASQVQRDRELGIGQTTVQASRSSTDPLKTSSGQDKSKPPQAKKISSSRKLRGCLPKRRARAN